MQRSTRVIRRSRWWRRTAVRVEEEVHFDFAVVNGGKKKLEVDFADGRTHDLVVLDSLGREVWRWSEGRLFTQAMQNRVLRASDALRFDEEWEARCRGSTRRWRRWRAGTIGRSSGRISLSLRANGA
ncbi:MAG: hypothetical protein IPJ78_19010 [Gemmatimonadetes bacterium]|nr:hypothetical protein [Gemmatimonadota bacterium]